MMMKTKVQVQVVLILVHAVIPAQVQRIVKIKENLSQREKEVLAEHHRKMTKRKRKKRN